MASPLFCTCHLKVSHHTFVEVCWEVCASCEYSEDVTKQYSQCAFILCLTIVTVLFDVT